MSKNIFEELPPRKGGAAKPMGDAAASVEKKARQLVYDSRYEVKKMLAGKKADSAMQERMVLERIAKSTAVPAVKARARQMVSKKAAVVEDFIPTIEDAAATSIANAMFKVFVEGVNEEVVLDYLEELNSVGDKKYKIRVTDPKTGNSYVRYGTREKITQLRTRKEEKDYLPGNQERLDVNKNGKLDSNDFELLRSKKKKKVDEEFLADGTDSTEGKNKSQITGKGVDNYASGVIKISPEDGTQLDTKPKNVYAHTELEGEVLTEKAKSKAQARFMRMVYATKKGKKAMSPEVAAAAKSMTKKEARKFAKTKDKGLPEKVEVKEASCSPDSGEQTKDNRGDYAKVNLIKNKLRAMGAKNPIVMVAPSEDVKEGSFDINPSAHRKMQRIEKATELKNKTIGPESGAAGEAIRRMGGSGASLLVQKAHFEPKGNVISEREFD